MMEDINEQLHMQLLNFDDTKRQEWMKSRKPFSALFELTPRCNFSCIHCYLQESHFEQEISYESIISIIDILFEQGILFLTFTGGEAMLRADFLDIYMYAKKKGFMVEVFTNGSCFTEQILDAMEQYPPLLVSITLYGATDITYEKVTGVGKAYETVLRNCAQLKQRNIRFSLKTPVMSLTLPELEQMQDIAKRFGVELVYSYDILPTTKRSKCNQCLQVPLSVVLDNEFSDHMRQVARGERSAFSDKEIAEKISADEHVYTCNVAVNSFLIDYFGNICPCMRLRHRGVPLTKTNFHEVWRSFAAYSQLKATSANKCVGCTSRYYCDTCPGESDLLRGNPETVSESICKTARIRQLYYEGIKTKEECLEIAAKDYEGR